MDAFYCYHFNLLKKLQIHFFLKRSFRLVSFKHFTSSNKGPCLTLKIQHARSPQYPKTKYNVFICMLSITGCRKTIRDAQDAIWGEKAPTRDCFRGRFLQSLKQVEGTLFKSLLKTRTVIQ